MSGDERSPKRQRLNSYSPASTPTETKSTPAPFVPQHPNTPPPSVHMSPSWHSQSQPLPGLGMAGNGSGGGVSFPTPPSPMGETGGSAQQTPAADGERPETETDGKGGSGGGDGDVHMAEDAAHRRTDHERTEGEDEAMDTAPPHADSSTVGLSYLPIQPVARSQPHASQNYFTLYNLTDVQASVARIDPVTGEKINKLRRTYQGKVKDLGLEGRNTAAPNLGQLGGLMEAGWDFIVPDGRTFWESTREHVDFSERGMEGMMTDLVGSALGGMQKGRLPRVEDRQWKDQLGLEGAKAAASTVDSSAAPAKTATNQLLAKTAPSAAVQRASAPASPRGTAARPQRTGKKRTYDDASFVGYGEDDGYSTGDGASRGGSVSASKRQKVQGVSAIG